LLIKYARKGPEIEGEGSSKKKVAYA